MTRVKRPDRRTRLRMQRKSYRSKTISRIVTEVLTGNCAAEVKTRPRRLLPNGMYLLDTGKIDVSVSRQRPEDISSMIHLLFCARQEAAELFEDKYYACLINQCIEQIMMHYEFARKDASPLKPPAVH